MLDGLAGEAGARQWLFVIVPTIVLVALLPTFVAIGRRRKDWRRVFAFNLVATLSWPAWIATLAWAATGVRKEGADISLPQRPAWFWPSLVLVLVAAYLMCQFFFSAP